MKNLTIAEVWDKAVQFEGFDNNNGTRSCIDPDQAVYMDDDMHYDCEPAFDAYILTTHNRDNDEDDMLRNPEQFTEHHFTAAEVEEFAKTW